MKQYECDLCGYVYDEAAGDPDNGIVGYRDKGYSMDALVGESGVEKAFEEMVLLRAFSTSSCRSMSSVRATVLPGLGSLV